MERKPEFHLYLYSFKGAKKDIINANTLNEIVKLVEAEKDVDTYQVMACVTCLFREGYRIFVHRNPNETYEIKLGTCECFGGREIRMGHDLPRLIVASF